MTQISNIDSRITLDFLKTAREDQYFERKWIEEAWLKPIKLANEIIGMLNADGWILVLWVADNGEIQDLKTINPDLLDQYRTVCFDHIKPPANIKLEEVELEGGKLIFLYHVDQDYERVFSRNDASEDVYLRVGSTNKWPLTLEKIRALEYDKSIRKFEDEICDDFDVHDFRESVLKYYREKMKFTGDIDDLMIKRNLAVRKNGVVLYKKSAILLFAEDPDKYIPSAWVRYVRYDGIEVKTWADHNAIKDEEFYGCIPRLIEILRRFIYAGLRDYYYLDISQGKFMKISEYPEEAWLEGIVNALCHRSYNIQWNPIYIKQFDDRIEISNSGPLPAQVTVETIKHERFSRNPRVARVLADMGYVRELNEWVKRIYESMERSMLSEPQYTDKNNTVTLILRNNIATHDATISEATMKKIEKIFPTLPPAEMSLLSYLFEKHQWTIVEFKQKIGKTEQAIRSALNNLMELDILVKITQKQRDKNAIYTFKKS